MSSDASHEHCGHVVVGLVSGFYSSWFAHFNVLSEYMDWLARAVGYMTKVTDVSLKYKLD